MIDTQYKASTSTSGSQPVVMAEQQMGAVATAPDASADAKIAALQSEIAGLTSLVRSVLAERVSVPSELPPLPPLEAKESERDRILAAWAAEPRVMLFITAEDNDKRAQTEMSRRMGIEATFPPRIFQVNGVQIAVPVGETTSVPASIAALYIHTQNPYMGRGVIKPVTFDQAESRLGFG